MYAARSMSAPRESSTTPAGAAFKETRWTLVLTAKDINHADSERALALLCEQYQYPIYAFIRRKGNSRHDAQDLTQEFFHRLISKEFLRNVDRAKGRFRTFLLTALQRFLCNEWEKSQAQKRGGGAVMFTWDADAAEERYCREPSHDVTPEKLFERRWALALIESTMGDLKSEYERVGKARLFAVLQAFIVGEAENMTYADAARCLAISEGNARVWVHRIRQRYGELLRQRIAETVDSQAALDEEVRSLYAALGD